MSSQREQLPDVKPFTSGVRSPVVSPLTRGLLGVPLFLLPTMTAVYFAWTIKPPLTAAVLGANYWASTALSLFAARQRFWSQGRVSISVALAFAPLTTAATFIHLDKFHLDSSGVTLVITWFWLIAYGIYPIQLAVGLVKQLRTPGGDPPRTLPLPGWVKAILGVHAVVLVPLGILMFVAPDAAQSLWPWDLTPLTSRVLAAWVLAFGVGAAHAVYENEFDRVKVLLWCYPVLVMLQIVALARFGDVVRWQGLGAWVYVGFLASCSVLGAYGYLAARGLRR